MFLTWPFAPVKLRLSFPARSADGCAHQFGLSNGIGHGTAPFHGAVSPSIASRGGGIVTAPCAAALRTIATAPSRSSRVGLITQTS